MSRLFFLLFFFFSVTRFVHAQDFSNKGKDFWIAYPSHIDGTGSVMGIYLTSDVNATGTIQVGPTATIPFTVTANQVTRKFLGSTGAMDASSSYVYLTAADGVKTNAAIRITSDKPIVAYTHIIRSARSGATLALPTPVLGTEYVAPSYENYGNSASYGQVAVIATLPGTVIEITPTVAGRNGRPAGVPFQVTLANAGDVYQFQSVRDADISGTRIKSLSTGAGCNPIAVFSATTWSAFDCANAAGGDNLYQQLFPVRTWGKKFVTAPFINRPYDIYKIYVNDPATIVKVKLQGVTFTLAATDFNPTGKYYTITTPYPIYIEADQPVSVVQFIISQNCKTGCGTGGGGTSTCLADPEMVLLNPIEQTLSDITFFSAHQNYVPTGQTNITQHYVNIIISKNYKTTVRVDATQMSALAYVDIPGTNYAYLQYNLTSSSAVNPVHRITADTSFSAIVYGYGTVESYGYNGGTNVRDLYQYVTLQNQFASVNFPATCRNTPFNFAITLPYLATSLTWDFANEPSLSPNGQVVNAAPVPDSSFVRDGRTLYLYKLPGAYSFSKTGSFPVKVFANNPSPDGCTGLQEINYDVDVFAPPVADFSFTHTGCASDTIRFSDISNGNGRPMAKWLWTFPDGTTDTVKNSSKLLSSPGQSAIKFRAITDVGCLADTVKTITTSSKPIASFGFSGVVCPEKPIVFADSSTISSGTIKRWHWNFGNGNTVSDTINLPPSQAYNSAATYTAALLVESNTGCSSLVAAKPVVIHPVPNVVFNLPLVCLPAAARFQNLSSVAGGGSLNYLWNFGDGKTDTATNPVHNYSSPGNYPVILRATSQFGCERETTIPVSNIYAKPHASFTHLPAGICVTDSMHFTDGSTAAGSTVQQWFWDFGDSTTSSERNPTKKYNRPGNFTVQLHILSAEGCVSDTLKKLVTVNALPTASFSIASPYCHDQQLAFVNKSTPNAGNVNSAYWNFGDGTTGSQTGGFTHNFPMGTYTIALAVTTDKGCKSDTARQTIEVKPLPEVKFGLPEVCLDDAFAQFTDSTTISDGSQSSLVYAWNFGDRNATSANPNTSSVKNPQHRYTAADVYNVQLSVTSAAGCTASATKPFTVNGAIPTAAFQVVNGTALCSNRPVQIQNKSTVNFGRITKIQINWDVAGSAMVTDDEPVAGKTYSHSYPVMQVPQTYRVRFRAFSGGTCVNETEQTITVNASPKVSFAPIADVCLNTPAVQLQHPTNGNVPGTGVFSGRGTTAQGIFSPAAAGAGMHPIKYIYTTNNGCRDSAEASIVVHPYPIVNAGPDRFVLEGDAVVFQPQVFGNELRYAWSPPLHLLDSSVLNAVSTPLSDIQYLLTVTGRGGCSATDDVQVKVLRSPGIPNAFSPNGDGINDTWQIMYLENYPAATVEVFDRYGRQVLMSYGYRKPWDGKFNGQSLPVGTYYYIINPRNGRKTYTGSVTILK